MNDIANNNINISYSFENVVPYYLFNDELNAENSHKGFLAEWSFREGCEDYPIASNVEYNGKHDIDNIVFTSKGTVINESKNLNENFVISYSWFLSHILDRFLAYPIVQYYSKLFGYSDKIIFLLTIPRLKCDRRTELAIKGIGIKVLQTNKQVLNKKDVDRASSVIRRKFLSVLTNSSNNNSNSSDSNIANDEKKEDGDIEYQRTNPDVQKLLENIQFRNNNFIIFIKEQLKQIIKFKIDYIRKKRQQEYFSITEGGEPFTFRENIFNKNLYSVLLKNIDYNSNLCLFCKLYPCKQIEELNITRFLKGYNDNRFKEIVGKVRRCLKKRAYLFFFQDYLLFNIEPKTYKPKEVPLSYYIGDTI
jgi:hypothetical protein